MLRYLYMKLRPTTPASHSFKTRLLLAVVAVIMAVATPAHMIISQSEVMARKSSSQIKAEIRALNEDLARYRAEAESLRGRAQTLKQAMDQFAAEKAVIQTQINLNQAEHDSLVQQIADTEEQIEYNRDVLGETIADIHIEDQISPIEMVFSSKNISSFLDRQEYRNSVRDELKRTNDEIKALKAELEAKKEKVAAVLNDQKVQRDILAGKEAEQRRLLEATQGRESQYKAAIAKSSADLEKAQIEHQKAVQRELAELGSGGATQTDYPWKTAGDTVCRSVWDKWGYCYRQCTSYVAWKLSKDPRNSGYSYLGHAKYWWDDGRVVSRNNIESGHVIVRSSGPYGHVMFVEWVDGETIHYTDYNGIGGAVSPGQGTISKTAATTGGYRVISFR
jgi:surface antigen